MRAACYRTWYRCVVIIRRRLVRRGAWPAERRVQRASGSGPLGERWFSGDCWRPCCTTRSWWSGCPSRGPSGGRRNSQPSRCYSCNCAAAMQPAVCAPSRISPRVPWVAAPRGSRTLSPRNSAAASRTVQGSRRVRAPKRKHGLDSHGPRSRTLLPPVIYTDLSIRESSPGRYAAWNPNSDCPTDKVKWTCAR